MLFCATHRHTAVLASLPDVPTPPFSRPSSPFHPQPAEHSWSRSSLQVQLSRMFGKVTQTNEKDHLPFLIFGIPEMENDSLPFGYFAVHVGSVFRTILPVLALLLVG